VFTERIKELELRHLIQWSSYSVRKTNLLSRQSIDFYLCNLYYFVTSTYWAHILKKAKPYNDKVSRKMVLGVVPCNISTCWGEPPRLYRRMIYLSQAAISNGIKLSL